MAHKSLVRSRKVFNEALAMLAAAAVLGAFCPESLASLDWLVGPAGSRCSQAAYGATDGYENEAKVYQLCQDGDNLANAKSYSQALTVFRQAAALDRTSYSPHVHVGMANCYRALKQYPQAAHECEIAIQYDPNYCDAFYSMALTNYDYEHYDTAAQYIRKLLQISQDTGWQKTAKSFLAQIETYGNLKAASKEIENGHLDKARELLREAATHDPSEVSGCVHSNLAYVSRESGKPEQAIEENKKALQYQPDDKTAVYGLAIAYQDIGKYDDSIGWLRRYVTMENDPSRQQLARELINNLGQDKDKLADSSNSLPDYLDHMVGGYPLHRWAAKSLPIKVHVHNGKGVKGYKPVFISYIPRALDTWCNASGNKLCYKMVQDANDADIDVVWVSEPIKIAEEGRNRTKQGLAHLDFDDENTIKSVRVDIDTMHSFDTSKLLEDSACASVCMHELGHSLGLDHSANLMDIMFFGASSKQTGLPTKRDRATIARLYEQYPVSKLAPKEKTPAPMKFLPPPAFMPPAAPGADKVVPPTFLPPPIIPEDQKLTPPFFKPAPIDSPKAPLKKSTTPAPPMFTPAPLGASGKSEKKPVKSNKKPAEKPKENLPFFTPPPAN